MTIQHKIIGCIPARYASSRLPGKPLSDIAGKPMILHVVEKTRQCSSLLDVVVLTDDQRIFDVVNNAGYSVAMTSENPRALIASLNLCSSLTPIFSSTYRVMKLR